VAVKEPVEDIMRADLCVCCILLAQRGSCLRKLNEKSLPFCAKEVAHLTQKYNLVSKPKINTDLTLSRMAAVVPTYSACYYYSKLVSGPCPERYFPACWNPVFNFPGIPAILPMEGDFKDQNQFIWLRAIVEWHALVFDRTINKRLRNGVVGVDLADIRKYARAPWDSDYLDGEIRQRWSQHLGIIQWNANAEIILTPPTAAMGKACLEVLESIVQTEILTANLPSAKNCPLALMAHLATLAAVPQHGVMNPKHYTEPGVWADISIGVNTAQPTGPGTVQLTQDDREAHHRL
jgi:hypothetical protein